jgi:hypothetical protein
MFLATQNTSSTNDVFTTKPPQIHHKKPAKNTVENAKSPAKTPLHHAGKKSFPLQIFF